MKKVFTDTEIWNQRWFKRMSPGNKLAYNYIKDRCNHAGIWSMDIIQLAEDMGTDAFNLDGFLNQVNRDFDPITGAEIERERVRVVDGRHLWLVGYMKFHWANQAGKMSPRVRGVKSGLEILEKHGLVEEAIQKEYVILTEPYLNPNETLNKPFSNSIDTPSKGTNKDKDHNHDKDRLKEKGQNFETSASDDRRLNNTPVPEPIDSEEFRQTYNRYMQHVEQTFRKTVSPIMTAEHFDQLIRFHAKGHDPTEILKQSIRDGNKKLYTPTETKIHTLHGNDSASGKKLSRSEDAEAYLTGLYNT